jgi:5S rRNA maturation endonuclease (ribonuclease M5)
MRLEGWVDFREVKEAVSMEAVLRHYQVRGLRRQRSQLQDLVRFTGESTRIPFELASGRMRFHASAAKRRGTCWILWPPWSPVRYGRRPCDCNSGLGFLGEPSPDRHRPSLRRCRGSMRKFNWLGKKKGESCLELQAARCGLVPCLSPPAWDRARYGGGVWRRHVHWAGPHERVHRDPDRERAGRDRSLAGRALGDKLPKYKLPAGFQKGRELFNLHRALTTGQKAVIVVEGYFDCMKVYQAGFPNVVALMGCSLSQIQAQVLERFERVILMLDGDEAGRQASRVISHKLAAKTRSVVIQVPDERQPDQLSSAVIENLLFDVMQERPIWTWNGTMRSAEALTYCKRKMVLT